MRKLIHFLSLIVAVIVFLVFSIGISQAGPCELPDFTSATFSLPDDNPYLPISVIGSTYVYEAEDEDGLIRDYIRYSTDTEVIEGITCTVVYDVEWIWIEDLGEWRKIEETEDWYAWDDEGNFWYFGEDTVEYLYDEDWDPEGTSTEGSWRADVAAGVFPGIILPAEPKQGDCYQQEYSEGEAEDVGRILRLNAKVSVIWNDYEECMVMKEWTPLEPGNVEHKYYALGEGLVYIKELKEKTVQVELVDINSDLIPDPPSDLY